MFDAKTTTERGVMSGEPGNGTRPRTPNGDPIMAAKFNLPARRSWTVMRRRLHDRVSQGVAGPLTLICAPAGAGKTMLVSSWVAAGLAPGRVTWITLDEEDDRPGVFWSYVLAGLANSGVPVGDVGVPAEADAVDQSLLIRLAAGLSERSEPVVLILDQAQVLTRRGVPDGLDFLVQHASPHLRLVLVSRVEPQLPLHRYRVAGSVTEIGFEELAFTGDEARALLTAHGADPADRATRVLVEKARGWAASIRLAVLSLRDRWAVNDPEGGAGERDLATYFRAEVLNTQPPGVRDFLLRTSVVDRLWPTLAVELTGRRDAGQTLARLSHSNAFLVPGKDGRSYEYHPMVRDLLRAQLHNESPGRVAKLHRKAAYWFAGAGRLAEATEHATAAGDWGYAAQLVVSDLAIGRLLIGPDGARFGELFAGMPSDVAGPEAAVVQAAVASARYDYDACAKHLLRARELVAVGPTEHGWALQLAIAVTEAVAGNRRGDIECSLSAAATAQAMLDDADAPWTDMPAGLRALVLVCRGSSLLRAGDLDGAAATLADALATTGGTDGDHLRVACLGQLALAEAARGRLRKAAQLARKACVAADRSGLPPAERPPAGDVALAWVHTDEYDLAAARTHATRAGAAPALRLDPVSAGMLALVRARVLRARGDLTGAGAALEREPSSGPAGPMPPWLRERYAATVAALRTAGGAPGTGTAPPASDLPAAPWTTVATAAAKLAGGEPAAAGATVATILRRADLPLDLRVEAWLLAATCELAEGRTEPARGTLDRALALAATERLRRPVIEASPRLRRFLRQERELTERHAWLGAAVVGTPPTRAAAAPTTGSAGPLVEPLTDKEMEVLRYMAALLSTEEIARTMFVSVNTIKTHIRGVLRKLAATRRNEAIRRARELGLV
jgi:LuxR family maltose regulon positive regulatory protein